MLKKLNQKQKNKIGLMGATLANNILYMFINTFLVAYLFKLSNYDYKIISIYYIFMVLFLGLSFTLLAKIIKEKRKVLVFRFGIVFQTLFILTIALLKEKILIYYILLGIFYGIAQGFFWSSGHILININAGDDSKNFVSLKSIISKTLKVIFPMILGTSIEFTSFSYVAKIVIGIAVVQFLFSLFIKEDKKPIGKFSLSRYIQYLKSLKTDDMTTCYKIIALDGIVNYLLETLVTILIVMTFKTNISLGFLTTIFAICSILSLYIFQRKVKNNNVILKISGIAMIVSVFLLIFSIQKTTVILYNFIYSICLVLLLNNAEATRYSLASKHKEITKTFMVEHQVVAEFALNTARIIGYFVLFITSFSNNILFFKILLIFVSICIYLYARLLVKVNPK